MFDDMKGATPGSTSTVCGVFDGISFPRTLADLSNFSLTFELSGETYTVREFEEGDIETIRDIAGRIGTREDFQQFYLLKGDDPGQDVIEAAALSRNQTPRPEAKLAVEASDGTVIGYTSIDLHPTFTEEEELVFGDIGYFIDPEHSGKGIVTTAIRTVLDVGFKELSFPYVNVTVDPTNVPSVRILENLGGVKSGECYWAEKYQAERQAYLITPEAFYRNFESNYPF